jgi:hypothetical protein
VETTHGEWTTARAILARDGSPGVLLVYPTIRHLERLAEHATVADLLDFARAKPIRRVQPTVRQGEGPRLPSELLAGW